MKFIKWIMSFFSKKVVTNANAPTPPPVVVPVTTNTANPNANITLGVITGATESEKKMIAIAAGYVVVVIFSSFFKDAVMASQFTSTNGLTNEQIYNLYINTKMIINVDDFSGNWKQDHLWHTEGYEAGDGFVHVNRDFIDDAINMGSLMLHELSHEPLGFHHNFASELTSVPYSMNRIFMEVAPKLGITS